MTGLNTELNRLARYLRQAERVTIAGETVGAIARVTIGSETGWWACVDRGGIRAEGAGLSRWQARNAVRAAALAILKGAAKTGEKYDLTREGLQLVEPGCRPYRLVDLVEAWQAPPKVAEAELTTGLFSYDNRQKGMF